MQKVTPFLWFDGQAEQAARFYVSLLPDSRIDRVMRSPADTPSGPAGMVLTVEFTLAGTRFVGLNGGPQFPFTEAVSFHTACADQAEVDRLWTALSDGGSDGHCGWIKERWGLSWQLDSGGNSKREGMRFPRIEWACAEHPFFSEESPCSPVLYAP